MKLVFQINKEYNEHIDYLAKIDDKRNVHMVLAKSDLSVSMNYKYPYNIVAYLHTSSNDKSKHLCHHCQQLYPAFQYAKHAKESHK
jgi:hypothetical protein